jgi:capsular polysaccharide biosynthesis protein
MPATTLTTAPSSEPQPQTAVLPDDPNRFEPTSLGTMLAHPTWREHQHSLTRPIAMQSVQVPIASLRFGQPFVDKWPIRETEGETSWRQGYYDSFTPWVVTMNDVMLHSHAGIVLYEDRFIRETAEHTNPDNHHYQTNAGAMVIETDAARDLTGTYVSALAGANANYFHNVIDCVGRLASVSEDLWTQADFILVQADCTAVHRMVQLWHPELPLHPVQPAETVRVDRLILPTSVRGQIDYHPCLLSVFDAVSAQVPVDEAAALPRRFYIDRRGSWRRKLLNETELINALTPLGIALVKLEDLSIDQQIRLFRQAELIVAPHGAGLTNIVFARPGCTVLELLMDANVTWLFRHLCAVRGVNYDCVIGPAVDPWPGPGAPVHTLRWIVSVPYVTAAIEAILSMSAH